MPTTEPAATEPAATEPAATEPTADGPATAEAAVDARVRLTVGPPAHGGHCVARLAGRVVFVRHALPGEEVTARVTEVRRGYLRADAETVHTASPDRVTAPCPHAGGGGCGGCDLQHATAAAQRRWKEQVVGEALRRTGGLTEADVDALAVRVDPLPGGTLGWRTRVRYAVGDDGRAGLRAHRSHRVVPVDQCRIAHPRIQEQQLTADTWPGGEAVEATAGADGAVTVREIRAGAGVGAGSDTGAGADTARHVDGPSAVQETALGREWSLPSGVFWQGHPAAAETLAEAVRALAAPQPGETCWDLYGGAGLFAAALAQRGAAVTIVESHWTAAETARHHLADLSTVSVHHGRVATALRRRRLPTPVDVVVLDPPRAGAGAEVVRAVAAAAPRAVVYVACDPAAFARDVHTFREAGWTLATLQGFDCFPMTQHVETVGLLLP